MANTILTVNQITRESLRVLHQEMTFISTINRQYDNSFAQTGAKIGDNLRIRLPNQYKVVRGPALGSQDVVEQNVNLSVQPQFQVPMNFTALEMTLSLDDFSSRIIRPAMSTLAANVESTVINDLLKTVPNRVGNAGAAPTFKSFAQGEAALTDNLAPAGDRYALLSTSAQVELVDALKGLFQDSKEVAAQYRNGRMGRTAGLDFASSTHINSLTRGSGNTGYLVNGTVTDGNVLPVDTGTGTIKAGDTFTIANVFRVHPETKVNTGVLMQFTAVSDYSGGAGNITVFPAIRGPLSEGRQTVNALPADNAAITILGTASAVEGHSLVYHKDAFTFATADLQMPSGVDIASRQTMDGISMRLVRDYDINADAFPCRIDILAAWAALRPQTACKVVHTI